MGLPAFKEKKQKYYFDRESNNDSFDLLFEENKSKNKTDFVNYFQNYHIYCLLGVILFLITCYLMFQFNFQNETDAENEFDGITTVIFEGRETNSKPQTPTLKPKPQISIQKQIIQKPLLKTITKLQTVKKITTKIATKLKPKIKNLKTTLTVSKEINLRPIRNIEENEITLRGLN